jgi:hydroxymethylbilane synthase
MKICIATRQSQLALVQTQMIQQSLLQHYPSLEITWMKLTTSGDKLLDESLATKGGKGLFIKELEQALLQHTADIAIHCVKDLPIQMPSGLIIPVICERADPRDVFVSERYSSFYDLPDNAVVGTSSLRRKSLLRKLRPELTYIDFRGNVDTRLKKMFENKSDAIILAAAGLMRLQLQQHIRHCFSIEEMLPAIGQGALAIQCRKEDSALIEMLNVLQHTPSQQCIEAERIVNERLGGGCHVPIAAHAVIENNIMKLQALVADLNGKEIIHVQCEDSVERRDSLAEKVANELLSQGASLILQQVKNEINKS